MSYFIKYPSIENSYNGGNISHWLNNFPELMNCKYTIEEKLDGSNLSIIIKQNEMFFASRNQIIGNLTEFNGLDNTIKKYENEIKILKKIQKEYNEVINFYFEFFGKGIQKRINYGDEKYIRLINIRVGKNIISPKEMYDIVEKFNIKHLCVPVLSIVNNLNEALQVNEIFNTTINPIENNEAEGVVIKPLNKVYVSHLGSTFYLKKKNPKFGEKIKKPKEKTNLDPELEEYYNSFCEYINQNRMFSVFSKEGKSIQRPSEIGYYISKIIEDAKADWYIDNNIRKLNKHEQRIVFNVGPMISKMLMDALKQ